MAINKSYSIVFFSLLLFFLSFNKSYAQDNFIQSYDISYDIANNATTHVNINVKIKNLSENLFTSTYKLGLGVKDIQNLKAKSKTAEILTKTSSDLRGSVIDLKFNDRVVGLHKILEFNIEFDTKDIARNLKGTWDINIPGVSNSKAYEAFNETINYPKSLGMPTFIKPTIASISTIAGILKFTKNDLQGAGVSITFGKFQIYNLNLNYHLKNNNLFTVKTDIALPPDTNYQTVQIDSLIPKPISIKLDRDGNWLATYELKPSQKIDVKFLGKVKVNLTPNTEIINEEIKSKYLSSQKYWDTQDKNIIKLAKELKTPINIYKFVVNKLKYDYSRLEKNNIRLGAAESLTMANSAVCLEFTDLFIALSRAAGIPAREVDGFAYTSNNANRPSSLVKDILHAWPEYYDFEKNKWIMVDPTWANTTGGVDYFNLLDFVHIAFVIKGESSTSPIPAGGYKQSENENLKDVSVSIADDFTFKKQIEAELILSDPITAGLPAKGVLIIKNKGNQAISNEIINVTSDKMLPSNQNLITKTIPPFGQEQIKVSFNSTSVLTNTKDTIKITVDQKEFYKNVYIKPFFTNKKILLGGVIFVSLTFIISIVAITIRRLSISRRK